MKLAVHNVYFCFSETGCTISLRDGTPCKEVPAHTPTLFVAQQPDMLCSDPAAVVRELPNGVELLHGQMLAEQPETGIDLMKYASFESMADLKAAYPDYKNDLTSDGGWIWPLTSLVDTSQKLAQHDYGFRNLPAKYAKFYLPKIETITNTFANGGTMTEVEVFAPKLKSSRSIVSDSTINGRKIKGYFPLLASADYAFHANYGLIEIDATFPSLSSGVSFLNGALLNKASVLRVLNSIPAYTSGSHPLTIGIHVDHQTDEEVLADIANAEAKGWTLTVQWNGTPTAQASVTYGLRKPPIYARVGELEDGEQFLDWGHYMTDPTGYEEFRSVEAAREYYGLPAEDLTNN